MRFGTEFVLRLGAMRWGMLGSLLVHAAAVAALWGVFVRAVPERGSGRTEMRVVPDDVPPPLEDPPPPADPPPPLPPEEPRLRPDPEPPEPEPLEVEFADDRLPEAEIPRAPRLIRLRTPLPGPKPRLRAAPPPRPRPRPVAARRVVRKPGPLVPARKIEARCRAPAYPERARQAGFEGEVVLRLKVSSKGRVTDVEVLHSSGSRSLDRAATECARGWRFRPASRDGKPVESWFPVRFVFSITG